MQSEVQKRIAFITLGCAKNEVDSAHMAARLHAAGYDVHDWVEIEECGDETAAGRLDAIIVNTCSFLREAIEENLEVIFDVASLPSVVDGSTKLVVSGCLPARFGDDLAEELTEADLFIPCAEEDRVVEALDTLFVDEATKGSHLQTQEEPSQEFGRNPIRIDATPSAYVKISDGCNRFCSFCAIPFIRGRYHSFPYEQIADEVAQLVEQGTKEIVLIAQDTGIWGTDLEPHHDLAWLLDSLAAAFPETWFRVLYIQPEHVNEGLLDVMAAHPNICNYLDIPLQHVDASLLKAMNRHGSLEEFKSLLKLIRDKFPLIALRTTFIVGFPGETEEQFEALCDFISEADFDYVGAFAFSAEEGTKAAELPDQIDEDTKLERLSSLRDLADSVSQTALTRFIGEELEVLVLGAEEDGALFGRSQYQAPDVDGITFVDSGEIGEVVPIQIEDVLYYEMEGSRVQ